MFCFKCGKSIADDSAFCPHCGAQLNAPNGTNSSNQVSKNIELDRGALKVYLRNVLGLECVVHKLTEQVNELNKKIKDLDKNNYYRKVKMEYEFGESFQFYYDGTKYYVLTGSDGGNIYYSQFDLCKKRIWVDIEEILPRINKKETWRTKHDIETYKYRDHQLYWIKEHRSRQKKIKKEFLQLLKEFKEQAPSAFEKNCKTISDLQQKYDTLNKKLTEVKNILDKAYQVNIVPGMFRNKVYAIYYLYDLIATSNLSFDLAVLNCNLEEIKLKLDKVIEKQQEAIINQMKIIAQNEQQCENVSLMLEKMSNIEKNTSYSATYAQMAANNTASMKWILTNSRYI